MSSIILNVETFMLNNQSERFQLIYFRLINLWEEKETLQIIHSYLEK